MSRRPEEYQNTKGAFLTNDFFFDEECLLLRVTHSSSSINISRITNASSFSIWGGELFQFTNSSWSRWFAARVFRNAGNGVPASILQLSGELGLYFGSVFRKNSGDGSLKRWSLIKTNMTLNGKPIKLYSKPLASYFGHFYTCRLK